MIQIEREVIVPYPYGSNVGLENGQPKFFLSELSGLAIDATAKIAHTHPRSQIILIGETNFGDDNPSTNDLMVARLYEHGINKGRIIEINETEDGRKLSNTYLQTQALSEHFADGAPSLSILSLAYHQARIKKAVNKYDNLGKANFINAEDILPAQDFELSNVLCANLKRSESILSALSTVDPKGRLLNAITRAAGGRVVDIWREEDGSYIIENTVAPKKLKQVQAIGSMLVSSS